MDRPQQDGGAPGPIGERRAVGGDALAGIDLRLAVERKMVGILRDKHPEIIASVGNPPSINPGDVLADPMQRAGAARAGRMLYAVQRFAPRQVNRQPTRLIFSG